MCMEKKKKSINFNKGAADREIVFFFKNEVQ